MRRRNLLILAGVFAGLCLLLGALAAGGAVAYFAFQNLPNRVQNVGESAEIPAPDVAVPDVTGPDVAAPDATPEVAVPEETFPGKVEIESGPAGSPGVLVSEVVAASPAEQAGLLRGDILLKVGDQEVNTPRELSQALAERKSGDEVTLLVSRGGEEQTFTATLTDQDGSPFLGVQACECGSQIDDWTFGSYGMGGIVITEVTAGSPADQAGLKVGDRITAVNGRALRLGRARLDLLANLKPGDRVTLTIQAGDEAARDVEVTLGEREDAPGVPYLGISFSLGWQWPGGEIPKIPGWPDSDEAPSPIFPRLFPGGTY